jgi:hypothetical protein
VEQSEDHEQSCVSNNTIPGRSLVAIVGPNHNGGIGDNSVSVRLDVLVVHDGIQLFLHFIACIFKLSLFGNGEEKKSFFKMFYMYVYEQFQSVSDTIY